MPYFKSFNKFFDYEKEQDKVWRKITNDENIGRKDDIDFNLLKMIKESNKS